MIGWGFSPVSMAFSIFIYFIEILVALSRRLFLLTYCIFIGQAMEGRHEEHPGVEAGHQTDLV